MPYRATMIMQVTTNPDQAQDASQHSGGWSESWWINQLPIPDAAGPFRALMIARANCLPSAAAIVGYRIAQYTLTGNKILPGGASSGRIRFPGSGFIQDIPQMALELGCSSAFGNSSRPSIKGLPDSQVRNGEYQPTAVYRGYIQQLLDRIVNDGWCILGRDLTLDTARVISINNGIMKLSAPIGAIAATDYVRLNRVHDIYGRPVTGSFYVDAIAAGNLYTLSGMDTAVIVNNSGSARVDKVLLRDITGAVPARVVTRKVGAPFERYRGKSSKRAVRL